MDRDYAPMPIEYLEEMALLTDEDFGRLMRALLRYAKDGTPVELDGDCRFYAVRVMNKDDYYAGKAAEEAEKAAKRIASGRKAAAARYAEPEGPEASVNANACAAMRPHANACGGMRSQTNTIQNKSDQNNTDQVRSEQNNTDQSICNKSIGTKPQSASVLALPLNDNSELEIYEEDVLLWQETYPAVDVRQELKEMKAWCIANPTLRKTRRGIKRFIVTWLSKEQDKGGNGAHAGKAAKPRQPFEPTEF